MNEPSFKADLKEKMTELVRYPCLCVNNIANYDYFARLKPVYYVIADPKFWQHGNFN
jgi:hypothetical protein